jgi:hypothetical protein
MSRSVMFRAAIGLGPILAIGVFAIVRGAFWGDSVDPVLVVLGVGCLVCVGGALRAGYRNGWLG